VSRWDDAFSTGKKALVAYLCVGDPDESESIDLALACVEAGADVLELGCPFSDPTADGPAIARASQRALAKGGGLDATLRVARAIRDKTNVPIVLFGYYNPLFVRGDEEAIVIAAAAGVDALLVVDVPIDESNDLRTIAARSGLAVIPLVAPTTRADRVAQIGELATRFPIPFVYYVSTTGVTGGAGAEDVLARAGAAAGEVRARAGRPTVVGFGIDSPERARIAASKCDGVVVGTAIVRRIEDGKTKEARIAGVRDLVASLRAAI
jgi:tryptophan synthase alpha chain